MIEKCTTCGAAIIKIAPDDLEILDFFDSLDQMTPEYTESGNTVWGKLINAYVWADERGFKRHSSYSARNLFGVRRKIRGLDWRKNQTKKRQRREIKHFPDDDNIPY